MEIWRPIPGFEEAYEVSNLARVRRILTSQGAYAGRIIKQHLVPTINGYLKVVLHYGGKRHNIFAHRALALAFIPNPDNKPHINHKNGKKTDNRFCNLEWVSAQENIIHACRTGLNPSNKGEKNGTSILTEQQVRFIRQEWVPFVVTKKQLADKYRVAMITVDRVLRGKSWTHI
jgi:hypothetical protein